jgi:hypothetical protein
MPGTVIFEFAHEQDIMRKLACVKRGKEIGFLNFPNVLRKHKECALTYMSRAS